jgi:predicted DCC family thiol-disulfide oxidoreductase YuxK
MIYVYYDKRCGICNREMQYYQKIQPEGVFRWIDVLEGESELKVSGISLLEAYQRIHAKDSFGKWHKDVDVFILIWRHIPKLRWISAVVSFAPIYTLAKLAYVVFAKWRFNRLAHCKVLKP